MHLCRLPNYTIIVTTVEFAQLSEVQTEGGLYRIVGLMGACLDKLLCPFRERKCKIVGRTALGVRLDNGTYTGILGELQSGSADMYLKVRSKFQVPNSVR